MTSHDVTADGAGMRTTIFARERRPDWTPMPHLVK